jgi:enoyl-CoA hydratase/carnithine racemase
MVVMKHMRLRQTADGLDASPYPIVGAAGTWSTPTIRTFHLEASEALVISKHFAGLSAEWVDQARQVVKTVAAGGFGDIKFLVFDLNAETDHNATRAENAQLLLGEIANLILKAPIVTIAHARNAIGGADLELALACNMLICDEQARFSFAADPVESVATYALLAQKIGFVRAERLMEHEDVLGAGQMRDMLLLKETTVSGPGLGGLEDFLVRAHRRHNSAAAMYRAQRIATPLISELFGDQTRN